MKKEDVDLKDRAEGRAISKAPDLSQREKTVALLLASVVLAIIAIALYAVTSIFGAGGGGGQLSVQSCSRLPTIGAQYSCIDTLANSTSNLSVCSVLPEAQRDSCGYEVASGAKNVSKCSYIANDTALYDQCILGLVVGSGNFSYCGALPLDPGLQCIYNLSYHSGFASISNCNEIHDNTELGQECNYIYDYTYALSQKNSAYCGDLEPYPNTTSLFAIANNYSMQLQLQPQNGIGSINNLGNPFDYAVLNFTPRDFCYYKLARVEGSGAVCGLIASPGASAFCNATYSK